MQFTTSSNSVWLIRMLCRWFNRQYTSILLNKYFRLSHWVSKSNLNVEAYYRTNRLSNPTWNIIARCVASVFCLAIHQKAIENVVLIHTIRTLAVKYLHMQYGWVITRIVVEFLILTLDSINSAPDIIFEEGANPDDSGMNHIY